MSRTQLGYFRVTNGSLNRVPNHRHQSTYYRYSTASQGIVPLRYNRPPLQPPGILAQTESAE